MSRSGIVNVRMVITEEKILSNIEKVQKMINPNSKKQIVQLEEDAYFKDLIEAIKTYLIEYPKKKNFILYCGLRLPSHSYIMKSVINGERYSVQKLTIHLFIPYLLYMSGSQRAVLIQKGEKQNEQRK